MKYSRQSAVCVMRNLPGTTIVTLELRDQEVLR
jgi:hypothetical protein